MNLSDQQILAKAKAEKLIREREAQIKAKVDSIIYGLNYNVHDLPNLMVEDSAILANDLRDLFASYLAARRRLAELGG